jgi:hypothetical protein
MPEDKKLTFSGFYADYTIQILRPDPRSITQFEPLLELLCDGQTVVTFPKEEAREIAKYITEQLP